MNNKSYILKACVSNIVSGCKGEGDTAAKMVT